MGRRNRSNQLETYYTRANLDQGIADAERETEEWGDGVPSVRELGKLGRWAVLYIGWFYLAYWVGFWLAVLTIPAYLIVRRAVASLRSRRQPAQAARPRRSTPLRAR